MCLKFITPSSVTHIIVCWSRFVRVILAPRYMHVSNVTTCLSSIHIALSHLISSHLISSQLMLLRHSVPHCFLHVN